MMQDINIQGAAIAALIMSSGLLLVWALLLRFRAQVAWNIVKDLQSELSQKQEELSISYKSINRLSRSESELKMRVNRLEAMNKSYDDEMKVCRQSLEDAEKLSEELEKERHLSGITADKVRQLHDSVGKALGQITVFQVGLNQLGLRKETYVDSAGKHRWRIVGRNHEKVAASSQGFASKQMCEKNYQMVTLRGDIDEIMEKIKGLLESNPFRYCDDFLDDLEDVDGCAALPFAGDPDYGGIDFADVE